jgi:pSer/pThr/pTyr-binding forkhead associated (FHA) protein
VVDTGSLNGTYVNHDRVDSVELKSGNEVQIGKFRLTFYLSPARAAGNV